MIVLHFFGANVSYFNKNIKIEPQREFFKVEKFLSVVRLSWLMSGKEFFTNRYERLGWQYREVTLKQAIRINNTNAKGKKLLPRLVSLGVNLQKIPFLDSGYWVLDSKVSAGATAEYLPRYVFYPGSSCPNPSFRLHTS